MEIFLQLVYDIGTYDSCIAFNQYAQREQRREGKGTEGEQLQRIPIIRQQPRRLCTGTSSCCSLCFPFSYCSTTPPLSALVSHSPSAAPSLVPAPCPSPPAPSSCCCFIFFAAVAFYAFSVCCILLCACCANSPPTPFASPLPPLDVLHWHAHFKAMFDSFVVSVSLSANNLSICNAYALRFCILMTFPHRHRHLQHSCRLRCNPALLISNILRFFCTASLLALSSARVCSQHHPLLCLRALTLFMFFSVFFFCVPLWPAYA